MNKHKTLLTSGIPKSLASPKRFFWIEDAPCVGPIVVDGLKNLWRCVRFIVADVNFVIGTFVGEIAAKETFKASNSASTFITVSASRVDVDSLTPTMENVGASVDDVSGSACTGTGVTLLVDQTRNACVGRTSNDLNFVLVVLVFVVSISDVALTFGVIRSASATTNFFVDGILWSVKKPFFFGG